MSLGEIPKFQGPLLPVWRVLSVNSVNTDQTRMTNMNLLCKLISAIPELPWFLKRANAVLLTIKHVNSVTPNSVNLLKFVI